MMSGNAFGGSSAGGGGGLGGSFNGGNFLGGLGGFLGGMFGNSGQPYSDAMQQYEKYMQQGANAQNPFLQAGQGAMGDYQKWLRGMQDPSKFINSQMSQYQQSPWAQYQQQQAVRSGQNAASASGLTGSTPFAQQLQQNAAGISSQDQQNYLSNVLGVNQQYGSGLNNMMGYGANAANQLTGLYGNMAQGMGNLAYGQSQAQNQDFWNMLGGGLGMLGSFF